MCTAQGGMAYSPVTRRKHYVSKMLRLLFDDNVCVHLCKANCTSFLSYVTVKEVVREG